MRKTYIHIICGCLLMVFHIGCKSDYPHIEYEGELGEVVYDNIESPVPVEVAINDPLYVSFTRGAGVFEDFDGSSNKKWKEADIYVYAFYSPDGVPGNPSGCNYNKPMNSKDDDDYWCLVDDAEDENLGHGKRAKLRFDDEKTTINPFLDWVDAEDKLEYNKKHQQYRYKFFAYHIDDAAVSKPMRGADYVAYEIEIDGTQDLMCSYATPTDKQREDLFRTGDKDISNNLDQLAYSTITGHRDLFPIFTMNHQLVFLNFQMKAGVVGYSDGVPVYDEAAFDVGIKNISIETKTKGSFVVASEDFSKLGTTFVDDINTLYMPTVDEGGNMVVGTKEGFNPHIKPLEDEQEVGAGFLIPEAKEYVLRLECEQPKRNADNTIQTDEQGNPKMISYTVRYALKLTDDTFKAGYKYDVTIHVYGHQRIELQLGVMTWGDGEDIVIDDEVSDGDDDLIYEYE